jgi:hypothetical protein
MANVGGNPELIHVGADYADKSQVCYLLVRVAWIARATPVFDMRRQLMHERTLQRLKALQAWAVKLLLGRYPLQQR